MKDRSCVYLRELILKESLLIQEWGEISVKKEMEIFKSERRIEGGILHKDRIKHKDKKKASMLWRNWSKKVNLWAKGCEQKSKTLKLTFCRTLMQVFKKLKKNLISSRNIQKLSKNSWSSENVRLTSQFFL